MTIERRHVGKRLSESSSSRRAASASSTSPARSPTIRRPTSPAQTQQVLAQIDRLLAEVGSDKTRILSATIYLPDMADFAAMNAVWEAWVAPGQTPARATVEAKLASPDYRVEIQVVAAAPAARRPTDRDAR